MNIPKANAGRGLLYPFDSINKGESYEIPKEANTVSVVNSARQYGKRHKKKFAARTVDGVTTIYRVK